ncbi:hypothetical protein [Spiroplasma clarkii]|nr:hypothetical protein [Spiroplasma clarkii]
MSQNFWFSKYDLEVIKQIYPGKLDHLTSEKQFNRFNIHNSNIFSYSKLESKETMIVYDFENVSIKKVKTEVGHDQVININFFKTPEKTVDFKYYNLVLLVGKSNISKPEYFNNWYNSFLEIIGLITNKIYIVGKFTKDEFITKISRLKSGMLQGRESNLKIIVSNLINKKFLKSNLGYLKSLEQYLEIKDITKDVEIHNGVKLTGLEQLRDEFENLLKQSNEIIIKQKAVFYSQIIEFYIYFSTMKYKLSNISFKSSTNQANAFKFNFEEDVEDFFAALNDNSNNWIAKITKNIDQNDSSEKNKVANIQKAYEKIKRFYNRSSESIKNSISNSLVETNKFKNVFLQSSNIEYHKKCLSKIGKFHVSGEIDFIDLDSNKIFELKVNKESKLCAVEIDEFKTAEILHNCLESTKSPKKSQIEITDKVSIKNFAGVVQLILYAMSNLEDNGDNFSKLSLYLVELYTPSIWSVKINSYSNLTKISIILERYIMTYILRRFWNM